MGLKRGAPPRFDGAATLLLDQVAKLKEGKATIMDTNVSITGMARDLGGREAIAAALKNLPEGFTVAANDVKAPPYVFQANKDPVANTLTLSGYVPDNNVHAALVAAAQRKFTNEKIVDNLKASIGAPGNFAPAVTSALGALSRLSTGTLVINDREVKLSGDALYDVAAEQIRSGLGKELPQGWTTKPEVTVKPAAAPVDASVCQQLFKQNIPRAASVSRPRARASMRTPPVCSIDWWRSPCAARRPNSTSSAIPIATAIRRSTRRCRKSVPLRSRII